MSYSAASGPLAASLAVDVRSSAAPGRKSRKQARHQEMESQLATLQKNYADLQAAVFEAAQVHRRLCAPRLVRHGEFEIASETFAARHLPGDFFSIEEDGDSVILALGDITGKGLAAGMWTTLFLGLVGTHRSERSEPHAIVAEVNHELCQLPLGAPLASLFLAKLDSTSGTLDYCSAGHPPALLFRADGSTELLSDGGPLLGVVSQASFVRGTVRLQVGDVLLAYSDGILEARNRADQEFGFDRLEEQARRARIGSADAVLFSVLGAVQDFADGSAQADDMSLVVLRRRVPSGYD